MEHFSSTAKLNLCLKVCHRITIKHFKTKNIDIVSKHCIVYFEDLNVIFFSVSAKIQRLRVNGTHQIFSLMHTFTVCVAGPAGEEGDRR